MKKVFTFSSVILILFAAACKKSNDSAPAKTVTGYWVGSYGDADNYPGSFYAFLFRTNGTVRIYESQDTTGHFYGEGTYTFTDSTVTTSYGYNTTAIINREFTFMQGTWASGSTVEGKFFLVKQ